MPQYKGKVDDLNFNSSNPKILNYYNSKGLQFEAVFMPNFSDYGQKSSKNDRNALYVAITRTYQSLYIMYSGILSSMMDGFSSIISNNLNLVMWRLTIVTIVLEIPNIMFAFYGINTNDIPFNYTWVALTLTAFLTGITAFVLLKWKKK